MNIVIVGLGVQGKKRKRVFSNGQKFVCTVYLKNPNADYKYLKDVPIKSYDAVYLCVPDETKEELINYCIKNNKHALIEKPFYITNKNKIKRIQNHANKKNILVCFFFNVLLFEVL